MPKAAVVMGSRSDYEIVKPAVDCLKDFGIDIEVRIMSAHRTPDAVADFAEGAAARGCGVVIAAAGKAAHLAGVIAAHTTLPVIGIPVKSGTLDGLDSLLSVVQMPAGVPVACVAINGSLNAALLAVQILALKHPQLQGRLAGYKEKMSAQVTKDDEALQKEISLL